MGKARYVCTDYNDILVRALRPIGIVLLHVGRRQVEMETHLETY